MSGYSLDELEHVFGRPTDDRLTVRDQNRTFKHLWIRNKQCRDIVHGMERSHRFSTCFFLADDALKRGQQRQIFFHDTDLEVADDLHLNASLFEQGQGLAGF